MKNLSLVYGMRLVPYDSLKSTQNGKAILKTGETKEVALHLVEGSVENMKKQLLRSIDAFFELLPGDHEAHPKP